MENKILSELLVSGIKNKEDRLKYKKKWRDRYKELRALGLDPYSAAVASKYKDEKYYDLLEELNQHG